MDPSRNCEKFAEVPTEKIALDHLKSPVRSKLHSKTNTTGRRGRNPRKSSAKKLASSDSSDGEVVMEKPLVQQSLQV